MNSVEVNGGVDVGGHLPVLCMKINAGDQASTGEQQTYEPIHLLHDHTEVFAAEVKANHSIAQKDDVDRVSRQSRFSERRPFFSEGGGSPGERRGARLRRPAAR